MVSSICQIHGPYDSDNGECPFCKGVANSPPRPSIMGINQSNIPTDVISNNQSAYTSIPTEIPQNGPVGDFSHYIPETDFDVPQNLTAEGILWIKDGQRRGYIHKIADGTTIGRTEGDIVLNDPKVSNLHVKFRLEDNTFKVWDLASKNGTFLNESTEKLEAATEMKENDLLKIGDTTFVLKVLGK